MKIALTAAIAVWLACGSAAFAQVQPPQDRINTALARARQVGIPVTLLESKVAEGKAKGISLERIAAAIERRETTLEHVSQLMKGPQGPDVADLSVAADAIDAGVSDSVVKDIADSAPRDRRAVAIATLTDLVKAGHVPEAALARVKEALKRGPEALLNLPAEAGQRGNGGPNGPQGNANGRGNGGGNGGGPPASVPAPGQSTEPSKPNKAAGSPDNPGRGNANGR